MKRALIALALLLPLFASAQGISQLNPWKTANGAIQAANPALGLMVPGLATSTTGCLFVYATGWIGPVTCGSGAGASSTLLIDTNMWTGKNTFTEATSTRFFASVASTTNLNVTAATTSYLRINTSAIVRGSGNNTEIYGDSASSIFAGGITSYRDIVLAGDAGGRRLKLQDAGTSRYLIFNQDGMSADRTLSFQDASGIVCVKGAGACVGTSSDNTWTGHNIFSSLFATRASSTYATSTHLDVTGLLTFGGVTGNSWDDYCQSITGASGLCDGTDDTGAFSTTSASYFASVGLAYSTTSTLADLTSYNKGFFFSTTSALAHLTSIDKGFFFSTTSADYWGLTKGYLTTDSSFSTTSASYFSSLGLAFSTTSSAYYESTLSARGVSTTLLANTNNWTGTQGFLNVTATGATSTYFSSSISSTTDLWISSIRNGLLATGATGQVVATTTPTATRFFATGASASIFPFATTTALSVSDTLFFANASGTRATSTYFSATVYASTTALTISNTRSAALITSATGAVSGASATSCTNQVLTAISAVMVGTCSSINNAHWSGTDLSVANGGTGLSTFGGTNHMLYTTATDTLSSEAALTYNATGDLLTVVNASTTRLSIGTALFVPNSASAAPTVLGEFSLDTTNGQLKVGSGGSTYIHDPRRFLTFSYATTTAWTGTTTLPQIPIPTAMTFNTIQCKTNVGTLVVQASYGQPAVNAAPLSASTTMGTFTWTTNNTPGAATTTSIALGNPASSPTEISCTITASVTGT